MAFVFAYPAWGLIVSITKTQVMVIGRAAVDAIITLYGDQLVVK